MDARGRTENKIYYSVNQRRKIKKGTKIQIRKTGQIRCMQIFLDTNDSKILKCYLYVCAPCNFFIQN